MARPVDWAAEERKLQPVYDDVQYGRLKSAKDAVERWLKKHPKSQPALVLRMVLAEKQRLGAAAVLRAYGDIKRTAPYSGRSVWFIALALKNIRRPDLVLELYQGIWDSRPDIHELGDQVFLAAAAMDNTAAMSAASRKLFNATKAPQWARLAAYSAWAHAAPTPNDADPFPIAPARVLLPATLMLRTTGTEVPSADILWLRLQVALGSGDVAEARRLIKVEGRKGSLNRRWVAMEAAKALAARGGDDAQDVWADEFKGTVTQLADPEAQHNYAFYRHLMTALGGAYTPERVAEAAVLFGKLEAEIGGKERAPALARLELDKAERVRGNPGMDKAEWTKAVKAYLARWGSKWTTGDELAGIAGDDRADDVRTIMTESIAPHSDERSFVARAVAELYLLKHGGESAAKPIEQYWTLYKEGLKYGASLPKTDVQPADPLGLAAVDLLLTSWAKSSPTGDSVLLAAAAALESIIAKSPSSFSARFTLVRVYRLLSAPAAYLPHLAKLNLSEIQLDNLLHIVSERGGVESRAAGAATSKAWEDLAAKAGVMYTRSATDLPEYLKQALEHESYSKVGGIRTLVKCMNDSVAQRALEAEEVGLAVATDAAETLYDAALESMGAALGPNGAAFIDNRNFELMAESLSPSGVAAGGATAQPTVDEQGVRALASVALRAARFVRGEDAPELPAGAPDVSGLGGVDAAYVSAIDAVLRAATAPAGAEAVSVAGMYEPLVALTSEGSTYARTHALAALAQAARTADAVSRRVGELARPVKGKKRPAGLVTLLSEMNGERDKLGKLEWGARVREVLCAPGEVEAGWVSDEESAVVVKAVGSAREEYANGLERWLGTGEV